MNRLRPVLLLLLLQLPLLRTSDVPRLGSGEQCVEYVCGVWSDLPVAAM